MTATDASLWESRGPMSPEELAELIAVKDARKLPGLVLDKNKRPTNCYENIGIVLESFSPWRGALAFDEFNQTVMLLRPIPGSPVSHSRFQPRPLKDNDVVAAARWFSKNFHPSTSKMMLNDLMQQVASKTILSPVCDYLNSLKWDGQPRLQTWLTRYLGAEQTPLVSEIGLRWLISGVARAMRPGCKADHVLVLEGPQGVGKSSALRLLASAAWFSDGLPDLHSKDASSGLRGKWIIELAELTAMRKSDVEAVKAFISRQEERFRPAYGRLEVVEPRRCVFAATTNDDTYLKDPTGNRRFWPVKVGTIDLAALRRDRDQLWAEAKAAYDSDERWWLDAPMEAAAAIESAKRSEEDPWHPAFAAFLDGKGATETTTRACLAEVLIDPSDQTPALARRAGAVLRAMGWASTEKYNGGPNRHLMRWVRR